MSQDADAGRLGVNIVADATGFEADLRRKVTTATERVKARIRTEVDNRGLQQALRADVRRLETAARIKARVEIDPHGLRASLQRAVSDAARNVRAKVTVDAEIDRGQLQRGLSAAASDLRGREKVKVPVEGDTKPVEEAVERTRRTVAQRPIDVNIRVRRNGLEQAGRALSSLSIAPAIAGGIFTLVGAVGNLAGGLTALATTAVQASGAVAAIPAAGAAAVQFLGTTLAGFSGVGDALKSLSEAQSEAKAAGGAGSAVAAQQQAATARVEAASRSLADARLAAADAAVRSSESIRNAEIRVATAQQSTLRAQQALNAARRDAAERLRDLRLELSGAALDEEGAQLAVQRAAKTLKDTQRDAYTSDLDRSEADLGYRQAQQRLKEVRESNADLRRSGAQARRGGVAGDSEVVDASNRVAEARAAEAEAQRDLNFATAQSARDQSRAATQVARAQQDLAKAQAQVAGAAGSASAAQAKANAALAGLTPQGRRFVRFIQDQIKPALHDLRDTAQAGLLPGVQAGVATLADTFLPKLNAALGKTSTAIGGVAAEGAQTLSTGAFSSSFRSIVDSNSRVITLVGDGLFHIANGMASLIEGSGPFLERVAAAFGRGALNIERFLDTQNRNGGIEAFFDRVYEAGRQWYRVLRNVASALGGLARGARPAGKTLLSDLVDATDRLAEWINSPSGRKAVEDFFNNTVGPTRQIGDLLLRLVRLLGRISDATGGGAMDGLFLVLDGIATTLEALASIPGVGEAMTAITLLAGAGFGLGLVAKAFGSMYRNLRNISRISGLGALLSRLRKPAATPPTAPEGPTMSRVLGRRRVAEAADATAGTRTRRTKRGLGGAAADAAVPGKGTRVYWTDCLPVRVCGKGERGARGGGGTTAVSTGGDGDGRGRRRAPTRLSRVGTGLGRRLGPLGAVLGAGAGAAASGATRSGARGLVARVGGKAVNLVKGGGIAGIAASIAGTMIGDAIAGDSRVGTKRRALGSTISGAATGAGIGATVGSIVPGVGTAIGAGVGGVVGGGIGLFKGLDENGSVWRGIKAGASSTLDNLVSWSVEARRTVLDHISRLATGAATTFSAARTTLAGTARDIRDRIVGGFATAATRARESLVRIRDDVREKLGAARERVADITGRIMDRFGQLKSAMQSRVREGVSNVNVRLRDGLENAREKAATKLDAIAAKFGTVKDSIVEAWTALRDAIAKPLEPAIKLGGKILDKITPDFAEEILGKAFGLADGAQVNPRRGGTAVRLAEAGRPETVVDSGLVNRRLAEMDDLRAVLRGQPGPSIVIQAPVTNAVPEPASVSLPRVLRESLHLAGVRAE